MSKLRLVSEKSPNPADLETVKQGLYSFNMRSMNEWNFLDIAIFLRDDDNAVQGGILGSVWSRWFHIEFLWIADTYQRQGYGDQLIRTAESEACAFGGTNAYVETFSFQALSFYEQHGYKVVGTLKDYPPGQTYYLLSKSLREAVMPTTHLQPYPMLLDPALHTRVWGGRHLETVMNKHLPNDEPYGESWEMHDTATVVNGEFAGRTLGDLLSVFGTDMIGAGNDPKDGMPLLVKFLDANDWLSVQVHPNDEQARELEGEPRGKTEAWYVIAAEPDAKLVIGLEPGITREEVIESIRVNRLEDALVFANVAAGNVLYVPAGTVHALGPGILVYEIQQSSDLTYRLYDWGRKGLDGKPRALHVDKGVAVANLERLPTIRFVGADRAPTVMVVQGPYFETVLHQLWDSAAGLDTEGRIFHALTCIDGTVEIMPESQSPVTMQIGQTVFIPAALGFYTITGTGKVLRSYQTT